jgi:hypothetical protein
VLEKADGVELDGGGIWNTSRPDTFLVNYWSGNEEEGGKGWLELWTAGDPRPRKRMRFGAGPVLDLVLSPDETGGVAEVSGEEEYNDVRRWSFEPEPSRSRSVNNVVKGLYLGVTRDGKVMLEGDDRELQFIDPFTRKPVFAPFLFSTERSISGKAVAAILKQSYGLRATGGGIEATLPNGRTAELYRDKVGARFEVGDKLVRGTVTEGGHVLSPDGKLMCGIRSYRSAGGRVGSMYDLVVREVETGRIIAGHYRLPSNRIVGFTPGNRAVLVQNHAGALTELYVHGGHDKAPDWYGDIGPALTGVRILPNLGLSTLAAADYKSARDHVRLQLQGAAAATDEAKQLILWHLF